jgi:hypothetical protein
MGSLLPRPGEDPAFAQIYVHDSDPVIQARHRMEYHPGRLDEALLLRLQLMMSQYNPYYSVLQTARERLIETDNISLHLTTLDSQALQSEGLDPRRYNRPSVSEIAVIIEGGEESSSFAATDSKPRTRDLIIKSRDGGRLQRVSELNSCYAPLRYPLFFPRGEQGWHMDMTTVEAQQRYMLRLFSTVSLHNPC